MMSKNSLRCVSEIPQKWINMHKYMVDRRWYKFFTIVSIR